MLKSEALLVSRIALLGDKKAFNQLVECYQSHVRRFFFNLTAGDEELSKDLAQDTFIKAWLAIGSFQSLSKFSTWLYRIAYNTFQDHIRANRQTFGINIELLDKYKNTETHNVDFNMDFIQSLTILNEDERAIMLLFYMEDQTIDKISQIINCPKGTIKSHLSRGKKKLSDYFKNSGYED